VTEDLTRSGMSPEEFFQHVAKAKEELKDNPIAMLSITLQEQITPIVVEEFFKICNTPDVKRVDAVMALAEAMGSITFAAVGQISPPGNEKLMAHLIAIPFQQGVTNACEALMRERRGNPPANDR
jgi:hypothetical protein